MSKTKVWGSLSALIVAVIAGVFAIEGGYVNDPNDSGGETNLGITEQVARAHGFEQPMGDLPYGLATHIYSTDYIYKPGFDRVLMLSPAVGTKVVDAGVNAGPGRSGRWLQMALNDLSRGGRDYPRIAEDGAVGPATLAAYQNLQRRRGDARACELVLKLMDAYQAAHYAKLGRASHAQSSFVVGWVDHRIQNVPLTRCGETIEGVAR